MKNKNKVVFFNILSTVVLQGIAFVTSPIFSRLLGTDNFGIVSVYTTWCMLFTNILSLNAASSLNIARYYFPEEDKEKYQSSILSLGALSHLLFGVLILIFIQPLTKLMKMSELMIILLLVLSFGRFCVSLLNTKYTFEFNADKNCYLTIITVVFNIGLSLLFVYNMPAENNYMGRILGQVITYGGLAVLICIYFLVKGKTLYRREYWKFCIPLCVPVILHSVSNLILGQSDQVMLQHMTNDSIVGIYSLAVTFSMVLQIIWSALNNSWSPFYHEFTHKGETEKMRQHARNYMELFTVLASGFVLLATEVYHIFADKDYWEGTLLIPILSLGYYFLFLYSFPVNFEFHYKKTGIIAVITLSAAAVNVVLNLVFINWFGYLGAAVATCVAHGLQFLFHFLSAKFLIKGQEFPFKMRFFLPYLLAFLAFMAFSMLTPDMWYIRWPIGAAIGIFELIRILKRKSIF